MIDQASPKAPRPSDHMAARRCEERVRRQRGCRLASSARHASCRRSPRPPEGRAASAAHRPAGLPSRSSRYARIPSARRPPHRRPGESPTMAASAGSTPSISSTALKIVGLGLTFPWARARPRRRRRSRMADECVEVAARVRDEADLQAPGRRSSTSAGATPRRARRPRSRATRARRPRRPRRVSLAAHPADVPRWNGTRPLRRGRARDAARCRGAPTPGPPLAVGVEVRPTCLAALR